MQGATSLAGALKEVDRNLVEVRAAPVVVERCRGGEVWHADASRVQPLHQSLVLGMRPPETGRLVTERTRAARVLVVAALSRLNAARYAAEVRRRLAASAGGPVEVTVVSGADERLAFRAARELDRRPALAALVAPARPSASATAAVTKVCAMLRKRRQEAVVSSPLFAGQAESSTDAGQELEAALAAGRLPVSRLPSAEPQATGGELAALGAAARANVQTLVRACWPGTLAPRLSSTRRGFSYVEARHTGVGVVSASEAAAAALLPKLRLWGYPASRLSPDDVGTVPAAGKTIAFQPGYRVRRRGPGGRSADALRKCHQIGDTPRKLIVTTGR